MKNTLVRNSILGGFVVVFLFSLICGPIYAQNGHSVMGFLRYDNTARTPLVGVSVQLYAMPGFVV
ncbi:MAG: hypothetical protein ACKO6M_07220, partial [Bacteroidota bacterium]